MEGSLAKRGLSAANHFLQGGTIELEENMAKNKLARCYMRRYSCWMYR